jgi:hypothetical protein
MMAARMTALMRIMPGSGWGLVPQPGRPIRLMTQTVILQVAGPIFRRNPGSGARRRGRV